MKKMNILAILVAQLAFSGAMFGDNNFFGESWTHGWENFADQMKKMQEELTKANDQNLNVNLGDLGDAASVVSSMSTNVSITPKGTFVNGKQIFEKGPLNVVNGVIFVNGKEVDPNTGKFKTSGAVKPDDVKSTQSRTVTFLRSFRRGK